METFGKRLKYIREYKGITQKELAEKVGVSVNSIKGYEADKNKPRSEQMEKIVKILDIKPEFLNPRDYTSRDSITALMYDLVSNYGNIEFYNQGDTIYISIDSEKKTECYEMLKASKQAYEDLKKLGMSIDDYKHWLLNQ